MLEIIKHSKPCLKEPLTVIVTLIQFETIYGSGLTVSFLSLPCNSLIILRFIAIEITVPKVFIRDISCNYRGLAAKADHFQIGWLARML